MNIKKLLISIFITLLSTFMIVNNVNAASASISVSANKSQVIVGDTVTVTVKISSSELLGSWKWSMDYNSSKFKMTSGESTVSDPGDGKIKSKSYTYKFKALATGSSSIGVKNVDVLDWSERTLSVSKGSKTIKVISQSDYQASLSKNNNLSSLSVEGLTLSPSFSSNTTEYKVEANANTNSVKISAKLDDSKADLEGDGTFSVTEGENKFVLTVTAQNGSVKKYTVIVNVIDPNPIKVTIDDKEYVVVKREANLKAPEDYVKNEVIIDEQKVPGFYNETNNFTLVGLKDTEGNIELFIYDKDKNEYNKYTEATLEQVKLYPLKMDKEIENYSSSNEIIDNVNFESLKLNDSNYSVIHARNLDTGKDNYYLYDSITKTLITYTDEFIKPYKEKITEYQKLIMILVGETILIFLILIGILINKVHKNNKKVKMLKQKEKELKEKKEEKKVEEIVKTESNDIKEEVKENNQSSEDNKEKDNIQLSNENIEIKDNKKVSKKKNSRKK